MLIGRDVPYGWQILTGGAARVCRQRLGDPVRRVRRRGSATMIAASAEILTITGEPLRFGDAREAPAERLEHRLLRMARTSL
jgi:hypothetical protein